VISIAEQSRYLGESLSPFLRGLLSSISKPLRSDLRWFAQVAATCGVLCFAVSAAFDYWKAGVCITDVYANISGVSGHDFEISETNRWHSPEMGILRPVMPTITSVDDHTIRIGLGDIDHVLCRHVKWEGLTIEYDIGGILYPGNRIEPRECRDAS
jgi:hypothetical protein